MSFIIPKLNCNEHQKTQITLVNLTKDNSKEQRLYCHRCNLRQQQNLYCLEDIYELASSLWKSEQEIIDKIQQDKQRLDKIKIFIDQIQAQYNKLEIEHQQLHNQMVQNQIIKQNNQIDIFLQKKTLCNKEELIMMAEKVSYIINQNCEKLELLENCSIKNKYKDQHEKLIENIIQLSEQLKWVEEQKSQIVSEIKPPQIENISQIDQQQGDEVLNYMKAIEIQFEQRIYDVKFNKGNNIFVVGSSKLQNSNCYAQVWGFENNKISKIQDLDNSHSNDVKSICFSISDDSFFTGSHDSTIILWNKGSQKWQKGQVLQGQSNSVIGLQLNNNENVLAAISSQIHLWTKSYQKWEKGQVLNECKKQFLCLNFNSDDSQIAAGSSDCQIYIYQCQNGQWKLKYKIEDQSQEVTFITFLNDQNMMGLLKDNHLNYYECPQNNSYECKLMSKLSSYQIGYSKKRRILLVASGKTTETIIYQQQQQEELKKIQSIQVKSEQVFQSNDGSLLAILENKKLQIYQEQKNQY